jgi:periplasmic protein TonB
MGLRSIKAFALTFLVTLSLFGQRPNAPMRMFPESMQRRLIREVPPEYPELARQRHIRGVVVMEIRVSPSGRVTAARIVSGHPLLLDAALDAVRQWTYQAVTIGGVPVDVITLASIYFPPTPPEGSPRG